VSGDARILGAQGIPGPGEKEALLCCSDAGTLANNVFGGVSLYVTVNKRDILLMPPCIDVAHASDQCIPSLAHERKQETHAGNVIETLVLPAS